jgi:two-component system, NtrC family, sensor histidine kinase KinB
MKRWSFVSGLTLMLLLMLGLSGYCVWVTRGLTSDLDRLIAQNYDKIRAIRELRSAMTTINARYLSTSAIKQGAASLGVFENEIKLIYERLAVIAAPGASALENERTARLAVLMQDYFTNYRLLFSLPAQDTERRDQTGEALARGTEDIGQQAQAIVVMNEEALFGRRDAAVARGRIFGWVAFGIAAFSTGIYIYTSVRLTQGVFQPLRRLRDAIQQVGQRKFETLEPLAGGEELTQIVTGFNEMSGQLRAYIAETDQRSVEASRISRALLEALPYPIYIVDEDYQVRLKNPRAIALSAALKISGHLPAAVRKCVDDAAALGSELIGDDLQRAVEIPLPGATGGPTPTFLPQVFRMAAVPGTTAGWAVLLVDVTRLRQFDRAKTKAIATLGHEVKTPVTTIRMVLHLLLEEKIGPLTPDQRELVGAGRDDCERLLAVLQALLELARFEGRRVEMAFSPTPPAELLAQAEAMHGGFFRGGEGALAVEAAPAALPRVLADPMHVVRVLGNFLSNAAKYRTPGTTVTMRAEERADGFVRLSVRNLTPRPLSEAEQAGVFDPFFRRAGETAEGSGLGLAICREIAGLHHGRVGVLASGDQVEFYFDLRCAKISPQTISG